MWSCLKCEVGLGDLQRSLPTWIIHFFVMWERVLKLGLLVRYDFWNNSSGMRALQTYLRNRLMAAWTVRVTSFLLPLFWLFLCGLDALSICDQKYDGIWNQHVHIDREMLWVVTGSCPLVILLDGNPKMPLWLRLWSYFSREAVGCKLKCLSEAVWPDEAGRLSTKG